MNIDKGVQAHNATPSRYPGRLTTMMRPIVVLAAALSLLAAQHANAQDPAASYPNKPVKVIVAVPAGGGVDTVTRIVTEKLRQKWGQPIVIENRGGAGGNVAAEFVSTADPDGYTLLASQPAPITTNILLHKKMNFDPTAIVPVAVMSRIPNVLMVRKDFPSKTAQEFLDYARANLGKLNYASQGIGTTSHLTAELFQKVSGTKFVHVPYKGTAPALNDLIAGHVDFMFMQLESALPHHQNGRARILAATTTQRIPSLPDIPTLDELGVKGCESDTWNAISAPPKTPAPIVAKINAAINEGLQSPDVIEHFRKLHLQPGSGTPTEFAAFVKEETRRWGEVIRAAGLTPQ
jgi:tripartite-type tricarboxylate transporter receptor subunit TctC